MQLSANFTLEEAVKSQTALRFGIDNTPDGPTIDRMQLVAVHILEPIRTHYGIPITPSSFFRCLELNRKIGSKDNSQHIKGEAVDVEVPGISNFVLATWVKDNLRFDQLILENYTLGVPSSGWVHCSLKEHGNRNEVLTFADGKTLVDLHA